MKVATQVRLTGPAGLRKEAARELRSLGAGIELREQIGVVSFSIPDISSSGYSDVRKILSPFKDRLGQEERLFYTWNDSDINEASLVKVDAEEWPGSKAGDVWRMNQDPQPHADFVYFADTAQGVFEPAVSLALYEVFSKTCSAMDARSTTTVHGDYAVLRPRCRLLDAAASFGFGKQPASCNIELFLAPDIDCGLYGREGGDPLGTLYISQEVRRELSRGKLGSDFSVSPVILISSQADFDAKWVPSQWRSL